MAEEKITDQVDIEKPEAPPPTPHERAMEAHTEARKAHGLMGKHLDDAHAHLQISYETFKSMRDGKAPVADGAAKDAGGAKPKRRKSPLYDK